MTRSAVTGTWFSERTKTLWATSSGMRRGASSGAPASGWSRSTIEKPLGAMVSSKGSGTLVAVGVVEPHLDLDLGHLVGGVEDDDLLGDADADLPVREHPRLGRGRRARARA